MEMLSTLGCMSGIAVLGSVSPLEALSESVKYPQTIKVLSSVMGCWIQWVNLCNGLKHWIKRIVL